jgi:hypothetical protein
MIALTLILALIIVAGMLAIVHHVNAENSIVER